MVRKVAEQARDKQDRVKYQPEIFRLPFPILYWQAKGQCK